MHKMLPTAFLVNVRSVHLTSLFAVQSRAKMQHLSRGEQHMGRSTQRRTSRSLFSVALFPASPSCLIENGRSEPGFAFEFCDLRSKNNSPLHSPRTASFKFSLQLSAVSWPWYITVAYRRRLHKENWKDPDGMALKQCTCENSACVGRLKPHALGYDTTMGNWVAHSNGLQLGDVIDCQLETA